VFMKEKYEVAGLPTELRNHIDEMLRTSYLNLYTTQNLLRITFSTVCYFCVFVINMKIDFKEINIIGASCT